LNVNHLPVSFHAVANDLHSHAVERIYRRTFQGGEPGRRPRNGHRSLATKGANRAAFERVMKPFAETFINGFGTY
jgi:hypothetical protein